MSITQNQRMATIVFGMLSLLLIPLIAMQFTNEVNWDALDFSIMGTLLLLTALAIEGVLRVTKTLTGRLVLVGMVIFLFLCVWVELAVQGISQIMEFIFG